MRNAKLFEPNLSKLMTHNKSNLKAVHTTMTYISIYVLLFFMCKQPLIVILPIQ